MNKLNTLVDGSLENLRATGNSAATENQEKQKTITAPSTSRIARCDLCKDIGWVAGELKMTRHGHMQSNPIRCSCKTEDDKLRRGQFLLKMDGLTSRERGKKFTNIQDNYSPGVLHGIKIAVDECSGLITLTGSYGVGKTTLLMCAVNEGRDAGKLAIYTTVTDLLSYLRSTFGPDAEESFDKYWDALIRCEILALDELDEFHTTPWAMERFLRLIDERWRRMDEVLTLCAINNRIQSLPGKIQSRLKDLRAQIIALEGHDMRLENDW